MTFAGFFLQENHFAIVKWLVEEVRCPIIDLETELPSTEVCAGAAHCGNLEMLKYLREKHFAWDESIFESATKRGHVHILKYAYEHGCQIEKKTTSPRQQPTLRPL